MVPTANFNAAALRPVLQLGVGGVLILGDQVPFDLGAQVSAADAAQDSVPLLVMADEEGGGVQRLRGLVQQIPWPRDMATTMSPAQVQVLAAAVGTQMRAAGVNVDLAPVVDVDGGPGPSSRDPDGLRSFSADPATAARYGLAFSNGLRAAGVLPVLKHFPGLGQSTANTDNGAAATLPLARLRQVALGPFAAAIDAGAPAVMISNATVPGLTSQPASLSPAVIEGLLRKQLHFSGLVLTDSLSTGAISSAGYALPAAAADSIAAGADLVLFGSTLDQQQLDLLAPQHVVVTVAAIETSVARLVTTGALPLTVLNEAVRQVLAVKGLTVCP